jgi:hypothetical protein
MRLITIKYKYVHPFSNVTYSPDKINVNPDFIKSNYLTACSNKNVKMTIVKIMMVNRWLPTTKVVGSISKTRCIYTPASFRERATINFYYRYHVK